MMRLTRVSCVVLGVVLLSAHAPFAGQINNVRTVNHAFQTGERLAYTVSWSDFIRAGKAAMEVRAEKTPEGRDVFRVVSTARSAGLVKVFYTVRDTVQSTIDAEELYSLSYSIDQRHGHRTKQRQLFFDQERQIVRSVSNGVEETYDVSPRIQDALSSLYYLRTRDDLAPGTSLHIDVFDGGKNWAVEVKTMGREKLDTILGKVDTIKVMTYPRYEGVFQHKGEIEIWFTDDARRIPVLMRSKISIGSIVATLTEMSGGGGGQ